MANDTMRIFFPLKICSITARADSPFFQVTYAAVNAGTFIGNMRSTVTDQQNGPSGNARDIRLKSSLC